ncbi:MAG: S9 family peptidase [Pseudomonadota bacterium]
MNKQLLLAGTVIALAMNGTAIAQETTDLPRFTADRVFDLEYADDPQISPDGSKIVYVRRSMDRKTDTNRGDLWIIDTESGAHTPLIQGGASAGAPRWDPAGERLLYTTSSEAGPELRVYYIASRQDFSLAQFTEAPRQAVWSPDGTQIALTQFTPATPPNFAKAPSPPKGAEWSPPVKVFDDVTYRFDGAGYLREGADHIYVLSAEGGSPRQITKGEASFGQPEWRGNGTILAVGNMAEDRDLDPIESEIYAVSLENLSVTPLTDRDGPDGSPKVSPNGSRIAYAGYDDEVKSYQITELYVMSADGGEPTHLTADYDRSITSFEWHPSGNSIIAQVENIGDIDLVEIGLNGSRETLATGLGGTSFGRPYAGASFSISGERRPTLAFTTADTAAPADVSVQGRNVEDRQLTNLNADVLPYLDMAEVREITIPSSFDGRDIQAWVAMPPDFVADGSFPMILEIHGGPQTMYGPYFSPEIQRFAAEGYVTVYANPRGSTGYGEAFTQLIDLNYPGEDYDDLMSVTDYLIAENYVDPDRLFVTGGSGGGVLTAWIVGKTNRFAAAATIKPVINWFTMALTGDIGAYVRRHWIRSDPWADPDTYWKFSPISLVGNVTTPTLVMVGEEDWRTPTWEAEQFYGALKLREVETALIRVPGSPHYIAGRPSRLIAKTDNIMGWFEKFDPAKQDNDSDED